MSFPDPRTPEEWRAYLQTLSGKPLRDKIIAANCLRFVQILFHEGSSASEVTQIFSIMADRMREDGQEPPGDGYLDLRML